MFFKTALNDVSTVEWQVDCVQKCFGEQVVNEGENIPEHVLYNTLQPYKARNLFCIALFRLLLISLQFLLHIFLIWATEILETEKAFFPLPSATENLPYLCIRLPHSPYCTGTVSDKLKAKQVGA